MKLLLSPTIFSLFLATGSQAFTSVAPSSHRTGSRIQPTVSSSSSFTLLKNKSDDAEEEIDRLRQMAAKLRAEAAALEAEQSQAMANAAERAFQKFDTNQDGEVTLDELKAGLESSLKMELSQKRVEQLMRDFDKSEDGKLQREEFVTLDIFRSRLDALAREEKAAARKASDDAKREKDALALVTAQMELINDKEPSNTDKLISVLPYLFPLLDGIQFARFLVYENPENPISIALTLAYAVYRLIPFGGLIAFFTLSFLSGNPSINRLIRFNMQQAIFLDIVLIFPGLIGALFEVLGGGKAPPALLALGSDAIFGTLVLTLGYCVVSSLLGQVPNKIPFVSEGVEARIPTVDMFDGEGRFDPANRKKNDEPSKKDDEDKK